MRPSKTKIAVALVKFITYVWRVGYNYRADNKRPRWRARADATSARYLFVVRMHSRILYHPGDCVM